MLERWIQWTCDGCEKTDTYPESNVGILDVRMWLRVGGWRAVNGKDFCRQCVEAGRHKSAPSEEMR